jgi:thiosulfate dehydrogenase
MVHVGPGGAKEKGDPQNGKAVYQEHCLVCHGREGKGDGLLSASLKIPPANLASPLTQARADADLLKIIQYGKPGTNMKPYKDRLEEEEIRDVLAHIRQLAQPGSPGTPSPAPGRMTVTFNPPSLDEIPPGKDGDLIRLGYRIVESTQEFAKGYVGNALSCRNCHLGAGRIPHAGAFVGLSVVYPEYRPRNGRINTIEDRFDQCFERSLNGRALPRDSQEVKALVAYIEWLSRGIPAGAEIPWRGFQRIAPTRPPDAVRGNTLFAGKCAACHGPEGQGTPAAPPLWGPRSYNVGAGMARVSLAAAFIKANMPLGQGGTLADDEAYDLAAFINGQPRPDFARKVHDWPKGDKPPDSPY